MKKSEKKDHSYNIKNIISNNIFAVKILFGATPVWGIYVILDAVRHIVINFFEQTVCI